MLDEGSDAVCIRGRRVHVGQNRPSGGALVFEEVNERQVRLAVKRDANRFPTQRLPAQRGYDPVRRGSFGYFGWGQANLLEGAHRLGAARYGLRPAKRHNDRITNARTLRES